MGTSNTSPSNLSESSFSSGVFKQFGDEKEILLDKDGVKVRVVGIPYHGVEYDFDRLSSITKKDEDYLLSGLSSLSEARKDRHDV